MTTKNPGDAPSSVSGGLASPPASATTSSDKPADAPPPKPKQKPAIGRIVHYVTKKGETRPAQMCREASSGDACNLVITFDGDNDNDEPGKGHGSIHGWLPSVPYDASGKPGTWHWPALG